jgi:hypothetical protein
MFNSADSSLQPNGSQHGLLLLASVIYISTSTAIHKNELCGRQTYNQILRKRLLPTKYLLMSPKITPKDYYSSKLLVDVAKLSILLHTKHHLWESQIGLSCCMDRDSTSVATGW